MLAARFTVARSPSVKASGRGVWQMHATASFKEAFEPRQDVNRNITAEGFFVTGDLAE